MKKKILIALAVLFAIVGVVIADHVDAWASVACPRCGTTNAVHITQGNNCTQGIARGVCTKCNMHFSVWWERKSNGQVVVTKVTD